GGAEGGGGGADPWRGEGWGGGRRRRHWLRLHRDLVPPGRALGDELRDHAAATGQGEQAAHLARVAAEAAHLIEPRRGRRARLRGRDTQLRGRERLCQSAAMRAR